MIKISTDQALERWDTLPLVLREALYSEANSDFLWKTCEAEHIPDAKIYTAASVSGCVLMGFLHPEDVASELKDAIGIDQRTASVIESALNQRIFNPLREEIDSVYAPLSKFEAGPTIIQEIKPPQTTPQSPSIPAPTIISESFKATPNFVAAPMPKPIAPPVAPGPKPQAVTSETFTNFGVNTTPLASNKNMPAPAPQPVKPGAEKGWSKQVQQDPVVKLGVITPSVPTPAVPIAAPAQRPPGTPTANTATGGSPTPKAMSEFDRLDMQKKGAAPGAAPAQPIPGPVMLHEIGGPGAGQKTPNFQVNVGIKDQMNGKSPMPGAPAKPAVLEFAGPQKTPTAAPHYNEYKPPAPTPPTSTHTLVQVTSAPQPAPPPKPPTPPAPPTAPGNAKVVVKDYR
jgi:hypothetical protein